MRKLILMVGLVALVLLVGCPVEIEIRDRGTCTVTACAGCTVPHVVPCGWCREGGGTIGGQLCEWEPDE